MYSMVLMVAMSASPETAACHKTSCCGCTGYVASCHGCYGGCFGGCHGCYGGCFGCRGGLFSGCHKSYSCCGCTGYVTSCCGYVPTSCCGCTGVVPPVIEEKKEMPAPKPKEKGVTMAPAYITVNVPADAKITINGANTVSTSAVRVFATQNMQPGSVEYYTFVAEVVRDGKTFTATEKVAVEAGAKAEISLNPNVGAAYASK